MLINRENLSELVFDSAGLITAVAQDQRSGEVLMVAWMTREAVETTLQRQRAVFWSRSRQRLWEKGEESGNTLDLVAMHADCDRDTLLLLVRPRGPACHEGTLTCFADEALVSEKLSFLLELEAVIEQRIAAPSDSSYTARLHAEGARRIAQKVGEEGVEVALAATSGDRAEVLSESADLLFHLAVLLKTSGLSLQDVAAELKGRHAARP